MLAIQTFLRQLLFLLLFFTLNIAPVILKAQSASDLIRLNQQGYYPKALKIAVVSKAAGSKFYVVSNITKDTVFKGNLVGARRSDYSPEQTFILDFTSLSKPGKYFIHVAGLGNSYPFEIKANVHSNVAKASLKGFYFNRTSTALPEKFAGKWARPAGHPDNKVIIHPSAKSPSRHAGTIISSSKGWYDAGDYNKYIVNSGITMGTLFSLYEDFTAASKDLKLNIPESSNNVPDLLDESLWNLRWMLTMQDPADGVVYHKLTNPTFDGITVMPDKAKEPRYVVQKSTAAALDFAAVMAQANRIFSRYKKELPGLSDSCLNASKLAWAWALKNPHELYLQEEINRSFDPDITTGEYGDSDLADEFIWAAAELYISTADESFYKAVKIIPDDAFPLPSWNQVRTLAYYSLLRFEQKLNLRHKEDIAKLRKELIAAADELAEFPSTTPYATVMGKAAKDFIWGSNAVASNQGILLVQAFRLTGNKTYLSAALANLDYLLGRNATGYSFLTGFGSKQVMHPHHRPSEADGIAEPVPGLLSGGPNPSQQDKCAYPSSIPDQSFSDDVCSYASNEIAINWNAPFVYLACALEALQHEAGWD